MAKWAAFLTKLGVVIGKILQHALHAVNLEPLFYKSCIRHCFINPDRLTALSFAVWMASEMDCAPMAFASCSLLVVVPKCLNGSASVSWALIREHGQKFRVCTHQITTLSTEIIVAMPLFVTVVHDIWQSQLRLSLFSYKEKDGDALTTPHHTPTPFTALRRTWPSSFGSSCCSLLGTKVTCFTKF